MRARLAVCFASAVVIVGALQCAESRAAEPFATRASAFFASVKESSTEFNCRPADCRAKASKLGLTFNETFFAVCDKGAPGRCALPRF